MKDAADSLTPVTLELGGKDPFVVCSDVKLSDVVPTALRAAFQSCGQNCVAAERFIVHEDVYEDFLAQCASVVKSMRQGDPLGAVPLFLTTNPHSTLVSPMDQRVPSRKVYISLTCPVSQPPKIPLKAQPCCTNPSPEGDFVPQVRGFSGKFVIFT